MLGPVEATGDRGAVALGGARRRAVLAALLFATGRAVPSDRLVEAVWAEPPRSAGANIRTHVTGLRRALREAGEPAERLAGGPAGYLLRIWPGELDLEVFEEQARRGEQALYHGDAAGAANHLRAALTLWRGRPLEGLDVGAPLEAEVARLVERRLAVLEQRAEARLRLGDADALIPELRALVTGEPLRERLWALLMRALSGAGRQADALDAYTRARHVLAEELGISPGEELRELERRILRGEPAPEAPAATAVTTVATVAGISAGRQLPMDITEFIGRDDELRRLDAMATAALSGGTATVIAGIEGMAGVGKTRLAVHAAHRLSGPDRFGDLQLWVELHGFDPGRPAADPGAVLETMLRLLGVPAASIPQAINERATLFRDRLTGKRAILVLDDAADAEQVRPLLPGSPTCLVLITSRRSLTELDGLQPIPLGVFAPSDALTLLGRVAGPDRVAAEPYAAHRLTGLCGRLPMAIALAGRRLRDRPAWTVATLAERLEATAPPARRDRIVDTVHAAFALSYRALPDAERRMFRLLGVHPEGGTTVSSAAALADAAPERAEELLESLVDEHLLEQTEPTEYRLHDMLRAFARECAEADESPAERARAVRRLLTWYLYAVDATARTLNPHRRRVPLDQALAPPHLPVFAGHAAAAAWLDDEWPRLAAAIRTAVAYGEHTLAWQLPAVLLDFFYLRKNWDDWIAAYGLALTAARRAGDRLGEATVLNGLGVAYSDLRRFDEAIACHRRALELQREIGDKPGQAWNLNNLGVAHIDAGDPDAAVECLVAALPLFEATGDRRGEGICLANLGDAYRERRQYGPAVECLYRATAVQREIGDASSHRYTLCTLGDAHHDMGHHGRAVRTYEEAVAVSESLGDEWHRAVVRIRLGRALRALGRDAEARTVWEAALATFTSLGDPRAEEIGAELAALDDHRAGA